MSGSTRSNHNTLRRFWHKPIYRRQQRHSYANRISRQNIHLFTMFTLHYHDDSVRHSPVKPTQPPSDWTRTLVVMLLALRKWLTICPFLTTRESTSMLLTLNTNDGTQLRSTCDCNTTSSTSVNSCVCYWDSKSRTPTSATLSVNAPSCRSSRSLPPRASPSNRLFRHNLQPNMRTLTMYKQH